MQRTPARTVRTFQKPAPGPNARYCGDALVNSRYNKVLESWKKGVDLRSQIITKLADPDATNGQQERYSIDNCWYNDLPLVTYEKGGLIEEEATGGFTPSDMVNLDAISA